MPIPGQAWSCPGRTHPAVVPSGQKARALGQQGLRVKAQEQVCESAISWPLRQKGGQEVFWLWQESSRCHMNTDTGVTSPDLGKGRWDKHKELGTGLTRLEKWVRAAIWFSYCWWQRREEEPGEGVGRGGRMLGQPPDTAFQVPQPTSKASDDTALTLGQGQWKERLQL